MCTVFKIKSESNKNLVVAKNYDVRGKYKGMIYVNRKNMLKKAFLTSNENPVKWKSIYGSVTFSQVSKEFPTSGMNEQGLVVEQNTLWNTMYPDRDERPAIKELQWIQYMLDTCQNINEVIEQSKKIRIADNLVNVMFYICDATGQCCVIQYILGEEQVINEEKLKYGVLTNDGYDTCLLYLEQHEGYGKGKKKITYTDMSIDRYVITVDAINKLDKSKNDDAASMFEILDLTRYEDTKWQIVYKPIEGKIYYKSEKLNKIQEIELGDIDFENNSTKSAKNIDVDNCDFHSFNPDENYELLYYFFSNMKFLSRAKDNEKKLKELAEYVNHIQ